MISHSLRTLADGHRNDGNYARAAALYAEAIRAYLEQRGDWPLDDYFSGRDAGDGVELVYPASQRENVAYMEPDDDIHYSLIALHILETLQKQELIVVHDGAVLTWAEGDSKPKTRQLHSMTGAGAMGGAFWGFLIGLIFRSGMSM